MLQLLPRLSAAVMLELERILDNKPVRPPMISTLMMRWQSAGPPNPELMPNSSSGNFNSSGPVVAVAPNGNNAEEVSVGEADKEPTAEGKFCEIQWPESATSLNKLDSSPITKNQNQTKEGGVKEKRNCSLINFKSLDFSFKNLINRSSSSSNKTNTNQSSDGSPKDHTISKQDNTKATGSWGTPYLRIDTIQDRDEQYQESRRSTATLGNNSRQSQTSLLPTATPSPYLSIESSPNLRRSSTSDIIKPEPGSTGSPAHNQSPQAAAAAAANAESRRPSTSSLLRKARERKDIGGQMGRSISQLATPTAGRAAARSAGQRRKSMAAF